MELLHLTTRKKKMTLKQIITDPSVWAVPIATAITWFLGREKAKADERKTLAETGSERIDAFIKVDSYESERYGRLLKRVKESEIIIEDLLQQNKILNDKLIMALTINKQLMAELTLYKTIK